MRTGTKRCLVTGTSGHVGGAVARALLARGHEVVGCARRRSRIDGIIDRSVDLTRVSPEDLVSLGPFDVVVHAAACLDHAPLAEEVIAVNVEGTRRVLEAARQLGVEHIVFLSGVTVIGSPRTAPIEESHPTAPTTTYHASKLFGEHLCAIAGSARGASVTILRVTAPVGPGMADDRILPVFVRRSLAGEPLVLFGKGTRGQDYVDVRDVGSAVEAVVETRPAGTFNIGSGLAVSNRQLAEACIRVLASSSDVIFDPRPDPEEGVVWDVSIVAASETFGYRPEHPLDDSIRAVAAEVDDGTGVPHD